MDLTTSKRVDNDTVDTTAVTEIVRSTKFWFADGSVVLQAEHTQFCVHQSLLCRQSTVLNDLFTVPQPEDGERVDGRPLVHLVDKAADWENVLGCLYNGLRLRNEMKGSFARGLVSMLRLGDKYLFDEIKSFAILHLKQEFPTSFSEWIHRMPGFSTTRHSGYEIDLINIALELRMVWLLPGLFYVFLTDREPDEIFDGTMRDDGTVAHLDPSTQRRLALGRIKILKAVMLHPLSCIIAQDQDEENLSCCIDQRYQYLRRNAPSLSHDVSFGLDMWGMQSEAKILGFCPLCLRDVERRVREGCQDIWDALPSYFDLPPWDILMQNPIDAV